MAFTFRFEAALEVRKLEERKAQEAMAPEIARLNQLRAALDRVEKIGQELAQGRLLLLSEASTVTYYAARTEAGRAQRLQVEKEIAEVEARMEPLRQALREAVGRRKGLEMLREKEELEWRKAVEKKEEVQLAETALVRKLVLPL